MSPAQEEQVIDATDRVLAQHYLPEIDPESKGVQSRLAKEVRQEVEADLSLEEIRPVSTERLREKAGDFRRPAHLP